MDCKEMILSEDTYDIITDFSASEFLGDDNNCYERIGEDFLILYLANLGIRNPKIDFFPYHNMPKLYGLMQLSPSGETPPGAAPFDPASLIASGITQVQRPPLSLTGQGVILCFIDTGIDYQNPVFLDENGNSRVLAIWDQTVQTGAPPDGLKYGSEYRREDINLALRSEDPYSIVPSRDENGHGSILAGVAAGSIVRQGSPYIGAAPGADIVVVKLKECKQYLRSFYLVPEGVPAYQENDIMAGIQYLVELANRLQLPLVLCLALGSNQGDHMGYTPLDISLQNLGTVPGIASVTAAGNEAGKAHHYFGSITGNTESASVEILVPDGCKGFFVELWCFPPELFSVGFRSPSGEVIPRVPARLGQMQSIPFFLDRTRIELYYEVVQSTSGSQLIFLRFVAPTPGIWTIQVYASGNSRSEFHLWLPISGFISTNVTFLTPDSYTTITAPGNSVYVITAGAYDAYSKSIYLNSSRGYRRNLRVKPDLCAPGVNVTGPGARDRYIQRDGTSAAAALTAGSCALLMEWGRNLPVPRYLSTYEMKNLLIRGAARNQDLFYPNREWGYGTLDVYQVFRAISTT